MTKPMLFEPLQLRSLEVRHCGWVSPMCQYSCDEDNAPEVPNDLHLVYLGSLATGGAALIVAEATAVRPVGRISPRDTGLWNDAQIEGWRRMTDFVHAQDNGAKIAVQIAHAGRKASTYPPFAEEGGATCFPSGAVGRRWGRPMRRLATTQLQSLWLRKISTG